VREAVAPVSATQNPYQPEMYWTPWQDVAQLYCFMAKLCCNLTVKLAAVRRGGTYAFGVGLAVRVTPERSV